eukprot:scpid93484/ scgid4860/ 
MINSTRKLLVSQCQNADDGDKTVAGPNPDDDQADAKIKPETPTVGVEKTASSASLVAENKSSEGKSSSLQKSESICLDLCEQVALRLYVYGCLHVRVRACMNMCACLCVC